jgi:phosphopantothenoylcysteine decarboxylase/phosphopantothenate--cysteine ligase
MILIAPATADFIARLANGEADDILSTVVLASSCHMAIAPAMNQAMWGDDSTQDNLQTLKNRHYQIYGPAEGEQACGDIGPGRMLEPEILLRLSADMFESGALAGKHCVITGGPTREALDPVRFISNHSSGKMAYALAAEAAAAGARVTLISGPVNLPTPDRVTRVDVISARDMLKATMDNMDSADVFIGVAAVADYRPESEQQQKIKKSDQEMTLALVKNPDIISEVAALENRPLVVGFAAETNDIVENGRGKLEKKKLDLLFANNATETFNSDSISVTAISTDGDTELPTANKNVVAREMLQLISERLK